MQQRSRNFSYLIVIIFALISAIACGGNNTPNDIEIEFTGSAETIDSGKNATLRWTSKAAAHCSSKDFETNTEISGVIDVKPIKTMIYTIICSNKQSTVSKEITIFVSSPKVAITTHYVATTSNANDNNAGTENAPWRTIQFAVNQLVSGDTLIITAGIYSETILFSGSKNSGSKGATITLKGLDGAIIDGEKLTPKGSQGLITLTDVSYIKIENLELRNFKTAIAEEINDTPIGILINGRSSHLTIDHNNIHHIENRSSCGQSDECGPGANGIAVYGNTTTPITDLILSNNEVSHCILASSEAFTLNGNISRFHVLNNYVHDNNNIGFDFIGYESDSCSSCTEEQNRTRNGIVKGNRAINNSTNLALGDFSNNPWYEGDDGSAGGFYVDGGHHILFDSNYASQNDLGFEFASEHPNKSTEEILMINNFIYANREVGLTIGGYGKDETKEGGGNAKHLYIYNNSFYKNRGWGTEITFSYRVSDTRIANNILYGDESIADNFEAENDTQYRNIQWQNNLWWSKNNNDFSGIQGDGVIEDPKYKNAENNDLTLLSHSPAINRGLAQNNISTWTDSFWQIEFAQEAIPAQGKKDITGNNRFNKRLDIGASEYVLPENF